MIHMMEHDLYSERFSSIEILLILKSVNPDPDNRFLLAKKFHRIYNVSTMTKKLVQHGNSAALIIDKPILELLKINFETALEITTDGSKLIIAPIGLEKSAKRVKESLKKINNKHSKTLKKLAK